MAAAALGLLSATATATLLCEKNEAKCMSPYPVKETILAGLETGTVLTYGGIDEFGGVAYVGNCKESSISWSGTENGGAGKMLMGTVTSLLFGNCKNGTSPCEKLTAQNLPYTAELAPQAGGNGIAWWVNGEKGVRKLKGEKCGMFGANCVYEGSEMKVAFTGGNPATLSIGGWEIKSEGGNPLCGVKLSVVAKYTVAAPKPVWVSGEP
jgi:hypothetical protein